MTEQFAQVSLAALDYERRVQLSLNAGDYRTAHSLPYGAPVPVHAYSMTADERALCTFRAHPVGTRVYARDGSGRQGTVVGSTDGLYPVLVRFDEYPTAGHAVPGPVEPVLFPDVQDEAAQTQHLRDEAHRTMDEAAEYERTGTRPSASGHDLIDRILHDRVERGIYSDAEQFAIRLLIDEEHEADAGIDYEATVTHAGAGQPDWATAEADRRAVEALEADLASTPTHHFRPDPEVAEEVEVCRDCGMTLHAELPGNRRAHFVPLNADGEHTIYVAGCTGPCCGPHEEAGDVAPDDGDHEHDHDATLHAEECQACATRTVGILDTLREVMDRDLLDAEGATTIALSLGVSPFRAQYLGDYLSFDEAEALGLDGTLRSDDAALIRYGDLTTSQRVALGMMEPHRFRGGLGYDALWCGWDGCGRRESDDIHEGF